MIYAFADCELNLQLASLRRNSETVRLRPKVLQVLIYLITHRDRVISKQELCENVWLDQYISNATLESTLRAVRVAIGDTDPSERLILTLRGHGYQFVATVDTLGEGGEEEESTSTATQSQSATILAADDDLITIKRLEAILEHYDYTILSAADGKEALDKAQLHRPDLILLDVMMPEMNGFEVCRQLKHDPQTRLIPVVLMTSLGEVGDRIKGLEAGADDFLTKPVHRDELIARIRTSLRLKQTIDHTVGFIQKSRGTPDRVPLYLTLTRQEQTIMADLAVPDSITPHGQTDVSDSFLEAIRAELTKLIMSESSESSGHAPDVVDVERTDGISPGLQRLGGLICSHFYPPSIRQRLTAAPSTELFLRLDEQLLSAPWELAFDGSEFWMDKFCIGRQVLGTQEGALLSAAQFEITGRVKLLIMADPTGADAAIMEEVEALCRGIDSSYDLEITVMRGQELRKIDLLLSLDDYDIVHYLGNLCIDPKQPHSSGWQLNDGVLTASEFCQVANPPLLTFVNAGQERAGETPKTLHAPQAYQLGGLFALAGMPHYIATESVVHDASSATFAVTFYQHLLGGDSLGAALSEAKQTLRLEAQRNNAVWSSYVHYGNPAFYLPLKQGV